MISFRGEDLGAYGRGTCRSHKQFEEFSGIDLENANATCCARVRETEREREFIDLYSSTRCGYSIICNKRSVVRWRGCLGLARAGAKQR